ncbi:MAG: hypothetical protein A3K90_08735 [Pelodictyon luteolum]|uniref:HTH cro/C1-type domain-containing protein n=1 Tax=Pelodictyon luteolum TaxID=1100 RepID=A0A165LU93_PELLU|nr:helix-turn-helix transcriptional regulator [Pelodictyon luteolum]KZK74439.1 MAG: hypothetical protein A3K90_08735 [Pelodictyon luteolum]
MKPSCLKKALEGVSPLTKKYVRRQGEFAVRLHDLMERGGMSQRQLAEQLGKKESYVSRVLSGSANPTLKTMVEFEVALGQDIFSIPYEGKAFIYKVVVPQFQFPATSSLEGYTTKSARAGGGARAVLYHDYSIAG